MTLAQTLADLAKGGVRFAAMEASSHGLDQFRLDGVRLAAAGFTNLTRDHLDYHGGMDAYRTAKLRLFTELLPPGRSRPSRPANWTQRRLPRLRAIADERGSVAADRGRRMAIAIRLLRAVPHSGGQHLELIASRQFAGAWSCRCRAASRPTTRWSPLPWRNPSAIAGALDRISSLSGVRGRMELAAQLPNGAAVYVDYAHTPDALERLLTALRPHTARAACTSCSAPAATGTAASAR